MSNKKWKIGEKIVAFSEYLNFNITQKCYALLPQVNFKANILIFTEGEGDGIISRLTS